MLVKRAVNEVDPENAHGFLLAGSFPVQHPRVNDDGGGLAARGILKFDAQPAVSAFLAGLGDVLGGDGVGEGKKRAAVAEGFVQALKQQAKFEIQHRLQAHPADITAFTGYSRHPERSARRLRYRRFSGCCSRTDETKGIRLPAIRQETCSVHSVCPTRK